jgi:hypothetical protein
LPISSSNRLVAREEEFLHFKKEAVRAQCKANMLELLADLEQQHVRKSTKRAERDSQKQYGRSILIG